MKKAVTLILFMFSMMIIHANTPDDVEYNEEIWLEENDDPEKDENTNPHKSQYLLPHVFHYGNVVQISSTYNINNVIVVFRDNIGNVIYSTVIPALSGVYSITLPTVVIDGVYSIELIYHSHHLIGYF